MAEIFELLNYIAPFFAVIFNFGAFDSAVKIFVNKVLARLNMPPLTTNTHFFGGSQVEIP